MAEEAQKSTKNKDPRKEGKKEVNFVRIMYTDINSEAKILYGLSKIKGVSFSFVNAMCHVLKYDSETKISDLTEKDIETIENFLSNPDKKNIPTWLMNNQKDYVTGNDAHLISKDLEFHQMQAKRRFAKIKSYRALRLRLGLTVRGQRTKGNFRRFAKKKGAGVRK